MSQINAAATSARESARSADGKFGSYSTGEADGVDLSDSLPGVSCHECGGEAVLESDGVTHHLTEAGDVDFDADADHVALDERQVVTLPTRSTLPDPPELTQTQSEALDQMAGDFSDGYGEADIDYALSRLSDERTELACVWDREDGYGPCGDSEIVGRVDGGPWRALDDETWTYLHETGHGLPEQLLSNSTVTRQDVEYLNQVTQHNRTIVGPAA